MVNTATICMYMHAQYCYNMYVHAWSILLQYVCKAWYISRITREYPTDSLLTTHAHYIREGFVGGRLRDSRTTWDTVILYDFV